MERAPADEGAPAGPARALELPESRSVERLVLSRGNLFLVTNSAGDIVPAGARDLGLFHEDTRYLSHLLLRCAGGPMTLLSKAVISAALAQMDMTITDREFGGLVDDPQNFLHVRRKHLIDTAELVVQIAVTNHLRKPIDLWVELSAGSDFADIFEVRGARRVRRGELLPFRRGPSELSFGYKGLDGIVYRTVCRFAPDPARIGESWARFELRLQPGESETIEAVVKPERNGIPRANELRPFDVRLHAARDEARAFVDGCTRFRVGDRLLQAALDRSIEDLYALRIHDHGRWIVGAGVPWYAAPFGRDALIAGLQTLPVAPELARETLRTLAAYQGTRDDPARDEEPGKIMHELRRGELARVGEIPHNPYYGSIDATPLFVILAGELHRWMGDQRFLHEIWPAVRRAIDWLDRGTREATEPLRYERRSPRGLVNQGWKDSSDAISYPDGQRAASPIALVEVQGYAVDAYVAAGAMARRLGDEATARAMELRAARMRDLIEQRFFLAAAGFYALAIDGEGRQVPTLSSNPGHLLFAHAVLPPRALRIAEVLLSPTMFSGFGIRTVGRGQAVYNPLSYHNGSVWPHDNALCGLGMARYGMVAGTLAILDGMRDAVAHFGHQRLPELFCGTGRGEGDVLVQYPVSCSPQAWSAGSLFMLLQGILGLWPRAEERVLLVRNPHLPEWLGEVEIEGLRIGRSEVTLRFFRRDTRCHVDVLDVTGGPLRVQIELD
jgi:glycogen debranching enzyme